MKKLFHYFIIFLVIYWCFNNIKGCSIPKVAESPKIEYEAPQSESEEHQCEGCTQPIEEVPQEVLDNTNANTCYRYLKQAIIKTAGVPKSFVEVGKKIEIESPRCIVVTIYYSVINDRNERVNRVCVGRHKYNGEGEMTIVDLDDKQI
jgi:hypothetical protein